MDLAQQVELLTQENTDLRERLAAVEAELGRAPFLTPAEWMLTVKEALLLGALLRRPACSKEAIMAALYDGRDQPEIKIVDVFVCKMRRKLTPFGITIETRWGQGYALTDDARATARAAIARLMERGR